MLGNVLQIIGVVVAVAGVWLLSPAAVVVVLGLLVLVVGVGLEMRD